jgi:hypothetical protein
MIRVIGANGADTAPLRFIDRKLHGLISQSMAKAPVPIDECAGRCLTLQGKTCTGDYQAFRIGLDISRKLDDSVGVMPR